MNQCSSRFNFTISLCGLDRITKAFLKFFHTDVKPTPLTPLLTILGTLSLRIEAHKGLRK
ncbi:hypothetical protein NOVOSPHI9U_290043 [Novosphingobium sp. 9U]|nr:hypothetical protein NOVOSPHI9U_290043 [Novosphingobium sp. 9U]